MSEKGPKVCGCSTQKEKTTMTAVAGALLGSTLGPFGFIIGSAVGGALGCIVSYNECKEKHKKHQLSKSGGKTR